MTTFDIKPEAPPGQIFHPSAFAWVALVVAVIAAAALLALQREKFAPAWAAGIGALSGVLAGIPHFSLVTLGPAVVFAFSVVGGYYNFKPTRSNGGPGALYLAFGAAGAVVLLLTLVLTK